MLQFESNDNSVFFLGHLLSFVIACGYVTYLSMLFNKQKKDKLLHSIISAAITFVLFNLFGLAKLLTYWWIVPAVVLAIGVLKEFIDLCNKKKRLFDWFDILSDLIGITSITLVYIFSFLLID